MEWILENKEWIFSGVGVLIASLLFRLFKYEDDTLNIKKNNKNNNNNNNNNNVINVNVPSNSDLEKFKSDIDEEDVVSKKRFIKVLFIDDDTKFKIIKILNNIGWDTKIVSDIDNIDSKLVLETHIFFVDINGVGKKMDFKDEGLGLANAIKRKYPNKQVVIYSSNPEGDRFHSALRRVDDFLNKDAEPFEFQGVIEQLAKKINK